MKYITVGVVLIIGLFLVGFLIKHGSSVSDDFTTKTGNNLGITPSNPSLGIDNPNDNATNQEPINNVDNKKITKEMTSATLHTSEGDITIKFFDTEAPNTVANFLKLAKENFYNGVKFHRVIKGFMIQGGDPLTKDDSKMAFWGTGGPGYKFADEIDAQSTLYTEGGYKKGRVAMANSGPNTNGSQFFIMAEDYPLPPQYTIFGEVTAGQDIVTKIENRPTAPGDRPITAVVIENITLK